MLPRSQRLYTEQLATVMEKGRVMHSPLFLMRVLKTTDKKTRIAAVAPKKIASTAVARNAMRRKIYDVIQPIYGNIAPGFHVVLFAKATTSAASSVDMAKDISDLMTKAGLIEKKKV